MILLCSPGWPQTYYKALKLTVIPLLSLKD